MEFSSSSRSCPSLKVKKRFREFGTVGSRSEVIKRFTQGVKLFKCVGQLVVVGKHNFSLVAIEVERVVGSLVRAFN